jgi:allantoate deiminase
MDSRADALAAASEAVLTSESLAKEPRNRGARLTVGMLEVHPNSITTIPGRVRMTVDIRDVDSDRQRRLAIEITRRIRVLADRRKVRVEAELIADTSPAVLPMWIRELSSKVCQELGIRYRVMTSGAGHDSQVVNAVVPAGIVFVPSRDGLSHVPEEWTSTSDIARGVEVLYHTVQRVDQLLSSLESRPPTGAAKV